MNKIQSIAIASLLAFSALNVSAQTLLNASYDVAKLTRAIVVGPIARLEFEPVDHHDFAKDTVIEAQLSAHVFAEQDYKEGATLVLTPRKARIFVES